MQLCSVAPNEETGNGSWFEQMQLPFCRVLCKRLQISPVTIGVDYFSITVLIVLLCRREEAEGDEVFKNLLQMIEVAALCLCLCLLLFTNYKLLLLVKGEQSIFQESLSLHQILQVLKENIGTYRVLTGKNNSQLLCDKCSPL